MSDKLLFNLMQALIFRPWTNKDLTDLVRHAHNRNIAQFLTDNFPHPYTEEDGKKFIQMALNQSPTSLFAIDLNGEAIGGIGIHSQHDIFRYNAELGYWLAEPYWGRGIMTQIIPQVVAYGFENFSINRIFARPFETNKASKRVLEKCGFELEAHLKGTIFKNDAFLDELIYSIRKPPTPSPQNPPLP